MKNNMHRLSFDRFSVEDSVYPPSLYMPPHTDKLSRITIILEGELQESHGLQNITATQGCLVIKPNHSLHENVFGNKPVRSLSVIFHDEHLFITYFNKWQWIKHPKINVLGTRFWMEIKKSGSDKKLTQNFSDFLTAVSTLQVRTHDPQSWLGELNNLLQNNLYNTETLGRLSEKFRLHRVYLSRAFKKWYGLCPVEFRKYSKISTAFFEVVLSTKSLAGIAYEYGFSDQSHMTREFMKCFDHPPAQLRQLMKKK